MGFRGDVAGWFSHKMAFWGQTVKDKFVLPSADWDENSVGYGSGNPGSESVYPISGFNMVLGMNITF